MNEDDAAAAAHHAPRGDRGIDPARQQACDLATRADRQTAGPALLAEVIESLVRERLDVNRQRGFIEVDRPAARFLDPAADLALDLRRCERETLVGTSRGQPEGRRVLRPEILEDLPGDRVDVE